MKLAKLLVVLLFSGSLYGVEVEGTWESYCLVFDEGASLIDTIEISKPENSKGTIKGTTEHFSDENCETATDEVDEREYTYTLKEAKDGFQEIDINLEDDEVVYDIINVKEVDDQTALFFGEFTDEKDGTTAEKRPVALLDEASFFKVDNL